MDLKGFKSSQIIFGEPKPFGKVAGSYIINLRCIDKLTKTSKGVSYTTKALSFITPKLFTFGPSESVFKDNNTWSMSLVLWDTLKGPTKVQKDFYKVLMDIQQKIQRHIETDQVVSIVNKPNLDLMVNALSMFFIKLEKGVQVKDKAPTIYPKLLSGGNKTFFHKMNKNQDIVEIKKGDVGKCNVVTELLIDSIFIGSKITVQLKLVDVYVIEPLTIVRSLKANRLSPAVMADMKKSAAAEANDDDDEDDDDLVSGVENLRVDEDDDDDDYEEDEDEDEDDKSVKR